MKINGKLFGVGGGVLLILILVWISCIQDKSNHNNDIKFGDYIPQEEKLNVLIVSFDALRADALGVYGNQQNTSGNIDKFASKAIIFDRAHTVSQSTPTSFAAMFTSKLPHRAFVGWKLVKGQTIANVFKQAGYYTSFITVNAQLNKKRYFDQGFDYYHLLDSSRDEDMIDEVLDKIDAIKDKKFFAWFHFLSPHAPYDLREESKSFYRTPLSYHGKYNDSVPIKYKLTEGEDIKHIKQLYLSEVFYADLLFKRILKKVAMDGLTDKTIIILTADHGEEFLEHGGIEHNSLFEEVTRIPFIIKHPHAMRTGRLDLPYVNLDLLPTLASMVKIPVKEKVEGLDLYDMTTSFQRKAVAIAMTNDKKVEVSLTQKMEKVINSCTPKKKIALFDLQNDPKELRDQASNSLVKIQGALIDIDQIVGANPCQTIKAASKGVSPEKGLSSHQIKKLKSLGYLK